MREIEQKSQQKREETDRKERRERHEGDDKLHSDFIQIMILSIGNNVGDKSKDAGK